MPEHGTALPALPPLSCDGHMHVFGPPDRYAGARDRTYAPIEMPLESYLPIADGLGLERTVLVQPSAYGSDNSCLLDTLRRLPERGRGVVVLGSATDEQELDAMHRLGVRGVRLNLMTSGVRDHDDARRLLERAAATVSRLGWHIQIYASAELAGGIAATIRAIGSAVVLDHMAGAGAKDGISQPGYGAILDLLAAGDCWVKLSGAELVTGRDDDLSGAIPIARALLAANSRRLVWGTDWPHLVHHHSGIGDAAPPAGFRPVSERALLGFLWQCVDHDETILRRILVENPERLYFQ